MFVASIIPGVYFTQPGAQATVSTSAPGGVSSQTGQAGHSVFKTPLRSLPSFKCAEKLFEA